MEEKLIVKNLDGQDIEINVIDIIENQDLNKEYICYKLDGMDDVFISSLIENDNVFNLDDISEEEKLMIEQYINNMQEDNDE